MEKNPEQKIEKLLSRGVDEIIDKEHLKKELENGKKLRVKFGIDPTSSDLHLGHSIPLRKLRQFQDLGHKVIFLIGDFTARIGDPSGRADKRKTLTETEVKKNMKDYISQAAMILDINKVEIRYNSEWFSKKGAETLIDLASRFTYTRLAERDEFKKRIDAGEDVSLLEMMYPLLQGYDSLALKADVEIGGTDQKFNLLFGRKIQKKYGSPEQDVLMLPLLVGTDGERKMSKSFGNAIKLKEEPAKMFGQIMSIPDSLIFQYFDYLTDLPLEEIVRMEDNVKKNLLNPKDAKVSLAKEILSFYHGKIEAEKAREEFDNIFREKKTPANLPAVQIKEEKLSILDLLVKTGQVKSKSEAQRMVVQGAVKINKKEENDWKKTVKVEKGMVIQVGKRSFIKIK